MIAGYVAGLLMGLATALLATRAWQAQRQVIAARHWRSTTGRIIRSGFQEMKDGSIDGR